MHKVLKVTMVDVTAYMKWDQIIAIYLSHQKKKKKREEKLDYV